MAACAALGDGNGSRGRRKDRLVLGWWRVRPGRLLIELLLLQLWDPRAVEKNSVPSAAVRAVLGNLISRVGSFTSVDLSSCGGRGSGDGVLGFKDLPLVASTLGMPGNGDPENSAKILPECALEALDDFPERVCHFVSSPDVILEEGECWERGPESIVRDGNLVRAIYPFLAVELPRPQSAEGRPGHSASSNSNAALPLSFGGSVVHGEGLDAPVGGDGGGAVFSYAPEASMPEASAPAASRPGMAVLSTQHPVGGAAPLEASVATIIGFRGCKEATARAGGAVLSGRAAARNTSGESDSVPVTQEDLAVACTQHPGVFQIFKMAFKPI